MTTDHVDPGAKDALSSIQSASLLADLVDALIPGDDHWPSASSIGVQGLVAARLCEQSGEVELGRIADAVAAAGGPLTGRTPGELFEIVARFEATEPELFERLRAATVLAYYQNPFVVRAIQALGRPYSLLPHLTGYPQNAYDPATDAPLHGRGFYRSTNAVRPVDTSSLDLDKTRTARWGIDR